MSRYTLSFVILVALLFGVPGLFNYLHTKSWETSEAAYASWRPGGGALIVRVRDRAGKPVAGAEVETSNNSGGDGGTTDAAGVCVIYPGEGLVMAMRVNGHKVIDRPYASYLATPSVREGGLIVDVEMKW